MFGKSIEWLLVDLSCHPSLPQWLWYEFILFKCNFHLVKCILLGVFSNSNQCCCHFLSLPHLVALRCTCSMWREWLCKKWRKPSCVACRIQELLIFLWPGPRKNGLAVILIMLFSSRQRGIFNSTFWTEIRRLLCTVLPTHTSSRLSPFSWRDCGSSSRSQHRCSSGPGAILHGPSSWLPLSTWGSAPSSWTFIDSHPGPRAAVCSESIFAANPNCDLEQIHINSSHENGKGWYSYGS